MCWWSWGGSPRSGSILGLFKDVLGEDCRAFSSQLCRIWDGWASKITASFIAFFGLNCDSYYGDLFLINLLAKLMLVDLIVGCWDAAKNGQWSPRVFFVQGICKFPVYGFYVYLVATGSMALARGAKIQYPITELFVVYLLVGEIYSILKHLHYIGVPIPEILLWFCFGFRRKVHKKIRELLPDEEIPAQGTGAEALIKQHDTILNQEKQK